MSRNVGKSEHIHHGKATGANGGLKPNMYLVPLLYVTEHICLQIEM